MKPGDSPGNGGYRALLLALPLTNSRVALAHVDRDDPGPARDRAAIPRAIDHSPFNPVTLNLAVIALCVVCRLTAVDRPSASRCLRRRPDTEPRRRSTSARSAPTSSGYTRRSSAVSASVPPTGLPRSDEGRWKRCGTGRMSTLAPCTSPRGAGSCVPNRMLRYVRSGLPDSPFDDWVGKASDFCQNVKTSSVLANRVVSLPPRACHMKDQGAQPWSAF